MLPGYLDTCTHYSIDSGVAATVPTSPPGELDFNGGEAGDAPPASTELVNSARRRLSQDSTGVCVPGSSTCSSLLPRSSSGLSICAVRRGGEGGR